MDEEHHTTYKDGDIVWVKLGPTWWPGEVKDLNSIPPDEIEFKKLPLAVVKFFEEDAYEYVRNWGNIYPFNCDKKTEFIKKGMAAFRSKVSHMEKFPKDVTTAEVAVGGNPNILSDPQFRPEVKRNYASEIFGTPSSKKKTNPETSSKRTPAKTQLDTSHITHRRFLGSDDYKAYICIQYPGKDRIPDSEDEEVIRLNTEPERDYNCHICSYSTKRLEVMILHIKCHIQFDDSSPVKKRKRPTPSKPKKKESAKKPRVSFSSKGNDTSSDEAPETPKERKKKSQSKPTIKKSPKVVEEVKPKNSSDIRKDLLAEWDEEEEELSESPNMSVTNENVSTLIQDEIPEPSVEPEVETIETDSQIEPEDTETVESEKSSPVNKTESKMDSASASCIDVNTQNDIRCCFDFDDEEEELLNTTVQVGRKIPRVIPPTERRKSDILEDIDIEDGINKDEILKVSQSFNEKHCANNELDDAFKDLMDEVSIPKLPDVDNSLKPTQNFHSVKTIKFPDKPGEPPKKDRDKSPPDVPAEPINPKKRIVQNFKEFENRIYREKMKEAVKKRSRKDLSSDNNDDSPNTSDDDIQLQTKIMSSIIDEAKIDEESKEKILSKLNKNSRKKIAESKGLNVEVSSPSQSLDLKGKQTNVDKNTYSKYKLASSSVVLDESTSRQSRIRKFFRKSTELYNLNMSKARQHEATVSGAPLTDQNETSVDDDKSLKQSHTPDIQETGTKLAETPSVSTTTEFTSFKKRSLRSSSDLNSVNTSDHKETVLSPEITYPEEKDDSKDRMIPPSESVTDSDQLNVQKEETVIIAKDLSHGGATRRHQYSLSEIYTVETSSEHTEQPLNIRDLQNEPKVLNKTRKSLRNSSRDKQESVNLNSTSSDTNQEKLPSDVVDEVSTVNDAELDNSKVVFSQDFYIRDNSKKETLPRKKRKSGAESFPNTSVDQSNVHPEVVAQETSTDTLTEEALPLKRRRSLRVLSSETSIRQTPVIETDVNKEDIQIVIPQSINTSNESLTVTEKSDKEKTYPKKTRWSKTLSHPKKRIKSFQDDSDVSDIALTTNEQSESVSVQTEQKDSYNFCEPVTSHELNEAANTKEIEDFAKTASGEMHQELDCDKQDFVPQEPESINLETFSEANKSLEHQDLTVIETESIESEYVEEKTAVDVADNSITKDTELVTERDPVAGISKVQEEVSCNVEHESVLETTEHDNTSEKVLQESFQKYKDVVPEVRKSKRGKHSSISNDITTSSIDDCPDLNSLHQEQHHDKLTTDLGTSYKSSKRQKRNKRKSSKHKYKKKRKSSEALYKDDELSNDDAIETSNIERNLLDQPSGDSIVEKVPNASICEVVDSKETASLNDVIIEKNTIDPPQESFDYTLEAEADKDESVLENRISMAEPAGEPKDQSPERQTNENKDVVLEDLNVTELAPSVEKVESEITSTEEASVDIEDNKMIVTGAEVVHSRLDVEETVPEREIYLTQEVQLAEQPLNEIMADKSTSEIQSEEQVVTQETAVLENLSASKDEEQTQEESIAIKGLTMLDNLPASKEFNAIEDVSSEDNLQVSEPVITSEETASATSSNESLNFTHEVPSKEPIPETLQNSSDSKEEFNLTPDLQAEEQLQEEALNVTGETIVLDPSLINNEEDFGSNAEVQLEEQIEQKPVEAQVATILEKPVIEDEFNSTAEPPSEEQHHEVELTATEEGTVSSPVVIEVQEEFNSTPEVQLEENIEGETKEATSENLSISEISEQQIEEPELSKETRIIENICVGNEEEINATPDVQSKDKLLQGPIEETVLDTLSVNSEEFNLTSEIQSTEQIQEEVVVNQEATSDNISDTKENEFELTPVVQFGDQDSEGPTIANREETVSEEPTITVGDDQVSEGPTIAYREEIVSEEPTINVEDEYSLTSEVESKEQTQEEPAVAPEATTLDKEDVQSHQEESAINQEATVLEELYDSTEERNITSEVQSIDETPEELVVTQETTVLDNMSVGKEEFSRTEEVHSEESLHEEVTAAQEEQLSPTDKELNLKALSAHESSEEVSMVTREEIISETTFDTNTEIRLTEEELGHEFPVDTQHHEHLVSCEEVINSSEQQPELVIEEQLSENQESLAAKTSLISNEEALNLTQHKLSEHVALSFNEGESNHIQKETSHLEGFAINKESGMIDEAASAQHSQDLPAEQDSRVIQQVENLEAYKDVTETPKPLEESQFLEEVVEEVVASEEELTESYAAEPSKESFDDTPAIIQDQHSQKLPIEIELDSTNKGKTTVIKKLKSKYYESGESNVFHKPMQVVPKTDSQQDQASNEDAKLVTEGQFSVIQKISAVTDVEKLCVIQGPQLKELQEPNKESKFREEHLVIKSTSGKHLNEIPDSIFKVPTTVSKSDVRYKKNLFENRSEPRKCINFTDLDEEDVNLNDLVSDIVQKLNQDDSDKNREDLDIGFEEEIIDIPIKSKSPKLDLNKASSNDMLKTLQDDSCRLKNYIEGSASESISASPTENTHKDDNSKELEVHCANSNDSFKFCIQTNLSNLSRSEEISAIALATMSELKCDTDRVSLNNDLPADDIPKPDMFPEKLSETEMVAIEGNLTVMSEKDLGDAQVEITSEKVISPKKPVTLSSFSMDFSDSSNDNDNKTLELHSKSTEFTSRAITKELKPKTYVKKVNAYNQGELLDILEGSDNSKKAPEFQPAKIVDDVECDFDEIISKNLIAKDYLKSFDENFTGEDKKVSSKAYERRTEVKAEATRQETSTETLSKQKSKHKPVILSEKIIKPASETKKILPSSDDTLKDDTDLKTFLIHSTKKHIDEEDLPVVPKIIRKSRAKPSCKAKILQQTIITPSGEVLQPTVCLPKKKTILISPAMSTVTSRVAVEAGPSQTISRTQNITPAVTSTVVTTPTNQDDNVFDIFNMPIVLSDQILTPESIESIPIVIDDNISGNSRPQPTPLTSTNKIALTKTATGYTRNAITTKTISQPQKIISKPRILQTATVKQPVSQAKVLPSGVLPHTAKPGTYFFVSQSPSGSSQQKLIAKKSIVRRTVPLSNIASKFPEGTGNKVMIVTDQQGQQQRVLFNPSNQRLLGYSTLSGSKIVKNVLKSNLIQKNVSAVIKNEAGPSKPVTQIVQKVLPASSKIISGPSTSRTIKTVVRKVTSSIPKPSTAVKNSKTILLTGKNGQTIKKIAVAEDDIDKQVAEQLEAIKASSGMQFGSQTRTDLPSTSKPIQKPQIRRSYSKKQPDTKPKSPVVTTINETVSCPPPPLVLSRKQAVPSPEPKKVIQVQEEPPVPVERPLQQMVLEQTDGVMRTITEGEIIGFPSGNIGGETNSYVFMTLDSTGSLVPVSNEVLRKINPNLALDGDLNNYVLQVAGGSTDNAEVIQQATQIHPAAVKNTIEELPTGTHKGDSGQGERTLTLPISIEQPHQQSLALPLTIEQQRPQQQPLHVLQQQQQLPQQQQLITPLTDTPVINMEVTSSNGDQPQHILVSGDSLAAQKFLESLSGTTDLATLIANADGKSILIQTDNQQILINTSTDHQMLSNVAENTESGGNPIFATHSNKTDILAAALADTDVFSTQPSRGAQLSPNNALYPINVGNVLETSLTLSSPIMTPLEVPSTNNKKISDDEADILTQVPKNVDLPITITDPNISQTVANQQVAALMGNEFQSNLELGLAITEPTISSVTTGLTSPSYSYSLPSLDENDISHKPFNSSMPLLNDDIENANLPEKKSDKDDDKSDLNSDDYLEQSRYTLGGTMCDSLSEPPPEMFEMPEVNSYNERNGNNIPLYLQSTPEPKDEDAIDASIQAESSSEGSCEIPLQPKIVANSVDLSEESDL